MMLSPLFFCVSFLAIHLAASPAPKQNYPDNSLSSMSTPLATDSVKPWSKESYSESKPWSRKAPKKHHGWKHKSKTKGSYPTMRPTGGYQGPYSGMCSGTGYILQATGSINPIGNGSPSSSDAPLQTGVAGSATESLDSGPAASTTSVPIASTAPGNGSTVSSGGISVPAGCQVVNGVAVGWLPGTSEKIGDIESALGITACFDGEYAQITDTGPYTDSNNQLLGSLTQITGGKTIFIASLMPSIALSSVDSTVAGGVANVMKQFTDKGIEVWLRFAHEMNYYVTDNTYKGTATDFQQAWAVISSAVASNSQVKMFWSPNQASAAEIESGNWFPMTGKVDIVGIDIYPKSQQTFGEVYGDFCKTFSTGKNLPFVIGETGAGPDIKQHWLGQLAQGDKSACPNYVGFSWFDYNKEEDFQVVEGGSTIAKQVLG